MLPKIHSLGSAPRDLSKKAGGPRWTAVEVNSMFQSQRTLTLVAWYVVLLQDWVYASLNALINKDGTVLSGTHQSNVAAICIT